LCENCWFPYLTVLCNENHSLSKDIYDIVPYFVLFCLIWIKFCTGIVHKNVLTQCECYENYCSGSHT
jgi:hypothetical protein